MPRVHFLNVKDGDCNVIEHLNGHISVIDVCNAAPVVMIPKPSIVQHTGFRSLLASMAPPALPGDFGQKDFPVNPIEYLKKRNIKNVFRFILTHPDMDHMDGIKEFFSHFSPANFWDTNNNKTIDWKKNASGKFSEDDWKFYLSLRNGSNQDVKRLTLHSDAKGKYYNMAEDGSNGGDGLHILAPTPSLILDANLKCENYHGCSYVILYITGGQKHKILFGGDSHDDTWEYILKHHKALVTNVDVLIAPHHGRASDRSYDFLDVLNPTITLFGNAPFEHLAYGAFNSRDLPIITNNQAGCIMLDINDDTISVYVTNKKFAMQRAAAYTFEAYSGYHYLQSVIRQPRLKRPPTMPPVPAW